MQYRITREECQKKCDGMVCTTCGSPITPFETVDNSRNPTHWPGCEKCHKFNYGVPQEVYKKAAAIKNDFYNVSIEDMCSIAWTLLPDAQAIEEERDRLEAENKRLREQYNSLIFEVSYKFPGESRHDTAKRYIREREEHGIEIVAKQALREALDRIESMATIENTEIQKIAREALKEASHE